MDAQVETCPYARYSRMREEAAVIEVAPGMYAVTRHEDCKAVLMDWRTYSAVLGHGSLFATFGLSPVQHQLDAIMADYPEKPVLMATDPPAHTRVRELVNRVLTPQVVEGLAPQIQSNIDDLAAPWIQRGRVEFVGEFAGRLPNVVTTAFLGSPPKMEAKFKFWSDEVMSRLDGPQTPERQIEVAHNIADMGRYFLGEIAQRRRAPSGDLVSLLAHAEIDGDRLEDTAIVNVIQTFLIGGHETTTFLLGNSLWRLANDPSLAARLRADPILIADFIEEMLRLEAPTQATLRAPTRDVEIGGVSVPAGATLVVTLGSANRDPAVFEAPEELRIERQRGRRPADRHLAFGYGVHACIGLNLARTEVRLALQTLLPRMLDLAPGSPDPIARLDNFILRGPTRLDLSFTPA